MYNDPNVINDRAILGHAGRIRRRVWVAALILVAAVCVVAYSNGMQGEFVSDDTYLRYHLKKVSKTGGWTTLFYRDLAEFESGVGSGFYRPISSVSLVVDGLLYGDRQLGYHLTNLALHILASCFVLALAVQFALPLAAALGAAVLFAVHPVHVEAVTWISGRFDVMSGAFYLLALLMFIRARARSSGLLYGLSIVVSLLALLAKEMAATIPAIVALVEVLYGRESPPKRGFWVSGWKGALLRVLPYVGIVLVYVAVRLLLPDLHFGGWGEKGEGTPILERLLTFGRVFVFYLGLLFWPARLNYLTVVPPVVSPLDAWFLCGVVIAVGFGVIGWRQRKTRPALSFGLFFMMLSMAPLSNLVQTYPSAFVRFSLAERYLYLPSFGFILAFTAILWEACALLRVRRRLVFATIAGVLVIAGVARTMARNRVWQDDSNLMYATVKADPENSWAHIMLALFMRDEGDLEGARQAFETALRLNPKAYSVFYEMGMLEMTAGQYEKSLEWFERALAVRPNGRYALLGRAMGLRKLGRLQEALHEFTNLVERETEDSTALVNQGEVLLALGQPEAAQGCFERAIVINPLRKEAHYNLAHLRMLRGDLPGAEDLVWQALGIDPSYADAYFLLGNVNVRRGDLKAARFDFEKAVLFDSTHVKARTNLGVTYLNVGEFEHARTELEAALKMEPSSQVFLNLAHAQARTGLFEEAEASFRASARLDSTLTQARRDLGLFLAQRPGRDAEARSILEGLVQEGTTDTQIESALERLAADGAGAKP